MPNESNWSRILVRFNLRDLFFVPQPPLIDRGFGLIYDTERDITWLQDVNYAKTIGRSRDGQLTWPEAMAWVASLSYRGIRGWRLPDARNSDGTGPLQVITLSEVRSVISTLDVFGNHPRIIALNNGTLPCIYWTSTEASREEAFAVDLFVLRRGTLWKDPFIERFPDVPLSGPVLSWPVHDGDVAAQLRASWVQRILTSVTSLFRG